MKAEQASLRQVAEDLALVEAQIRAAAVIVGAALAALGDSLEAEARRTKGARKAPRKHAQRSE